MRRLCVLLSIAFLGACATEAPPTADDTPAPQPSPAEEWASCTNTEHGFTVSYPSDWQTNDGDVMPECSLFDPEPIRVEPATEIPQDIAVAITLDEVDYETVSAPSRFEEETDRSEHTIDGRDAVRIEATATGEGLYDEGTRTTRWVIRVGEGRTLVAHSTDAGEPDYDRKQEVLDRMIDSLEFN